MRVVFDQKSTKKGRFLVDFIDKIDKIVSFRHKSAKKAKNGHENGKKGGYKKHFSAHAPLVPSRG